MTLGKRPRTPGAGLLHRFELARDWRALLLFAIVVVASFAAGYGAYMGKMKILGLLGLVTLGIFLRQASFANAYFLWLMTVVLAYVRVGPFMAEFDRDKWIMLGVVGALSVAAAAFHIREPEPPRVAHFLALALATASLWSTAWSVDPGLTFLKAGAFVAGLVIAFVGIWSSVRDLAGVRRILDVHADSLWLVFPLGVLLLPFGRMWYGGRFRSIFTNPNTMGFWGSFGIPLLLGLAFIHPTRWRRQAAWLMLACAVPCVVASGSRGGVLASLLGVGVYVVARWPRPTLSLLAAAAVVAIFVHAYRFDLSAVANSFEYLVRKDTLSNLSTRRQWWEIGILIVHQKPWLGHGFGVGEALFGRYGLDLSGVSFEATIHNSYLEAAMNIGLVGLGLVVLLIAWSAFLLARTWWRDRDGQLGLTALTLLAILVSISAHGAVESTLLSAGNPWSLPYWVCLALATRLSVLQGKALREATAPTAPAAQAA